MPFPEFDPVIFQIGFFTLRWYALAYIAGLWIGWWYVRSAMGQAGLWAPNQPPATSEQIDDLLLWVTLGVIIGGRLGYVVFYNFSYYLSNLSEIVAVWQGGMSFHGGFLGVVIAVWLFARKHRLAIISLGDSVATAAPFGLFFGRIANFINSELWGRQTDHPLGVIFPNGGPIPRHPSQLYEAALEGLVLFLILRLATHRFHILRSPGTAIGVFLIGYSAGRIFVEQYRQPDAHIGFLAGGTTLGAWLSLPMVLVGTVLVVPALRRRFGLPDTQ